MNSIRNWLSQDETPLFEAGVYYLFPPSNKPDAPCPTEYREHKFERFKEGKSFGIGRVFVMGRTDENFLKLIDNWNRKGYNGLYTYIKA